ncbi:hypothetical protein AKG95_22675 [Janthinobacterium lividum]|uniref:Uncharacterized protein n=1 Tax=Janthinobacterium lividum TaxID=29581 RepID=A0A1S1U4B0_9BURK|nr:hypothetical protein [Janthinobacterium lividum]OHV95086.1 hypothetical protein AKG95_22675 [Janthinobacterium lividum]
MNTKKTPDQLLLDAQIAFIMSSPDSELDEVLLAAGLDPEDAETRGTAAVDRALTAVEQANIISDALNTLPVNRQREVATNLGIRRTVFAAIAENRARVQTIPKRFLEKLSHEMGASFEVMVLALSGPVRFASAQHKSDQAPELPNQVTFEQLLRDSSMAENEIADLLRENI